MCGPAPCKSKHQDRNLEIIQLLSHYHQRRQQERFLQHVGDTVGRVDVVTDKTPDGLDLPAERVKQMRLHILLLLHAHKCVINPRSGVCYVPYCNRIQDVVAHLITCKMGAECTAQYCLTSKQMLWHYRVCQNAECRICAPIHRFRH